MRASRRFSVGIADLVGLCLSLTVLTVVPAFPDPFNIPKLLVFATVGIAALPYALWQAWKASKHTQLSALVLTALLAAAGFAGWAALSTLLAPGQLSAKLFGWLGRSDGLLAWLAAVSLFLLACFLQRRELRRLSTWMLIALSGVCLVGISQVFGWTVVQGRGDVIVATMGNSNFAAGYLGMMLPVALWRLLDSSHIAVRVWSAVALLASLTLILRTNDEQGRFTTLIAAGVFFATFAYVRAAPRSRRWNQVFVAVIAGGVAAVISIVLFSGLASSILSTPSVQSRITWWDAATRIAGDYPLLGTGPGRFAFYIGQYREAAADGVATIPSAAHNIALQVLASLGFPGLLLWITLFSASGIALLTSMRHLKRTDAALAAGILAALTGYLFQGVVSIDMLPLLVSGWVLAGMAVSTSQLTVNETPNPPSMRSLSSSPRPILLVGLAAGLVTVIAIGHHAIAVNTAVREARTVAAATNALKDPNTPCAARMRLVTGLTTAQTSRESLEAILQAANFDPRCPGLTIVQSLAAEQLGKPDLANRASQAAILYDPLNPDLYVRRAQLQVQQGDAKGAEQTIKILEELAISK